MTIEKIEIRRLLPDVFIGMEQTESVEASQIWEVPSVVFERGCKQCIQAESGQGKSSLLSFIYGSRNDYRGEIYYDNQNIRGFGIKQWCELRQRNIALLPQEMRLFPELTVMGNIEIKNKLTNHKTQQEIEALLERLGIADKRERIVGSLSIGEQQRVAIVRTVCQPFDFILLDEPVSHLDEHNNRIVAHIIEEEAATHGAGIITTSVGNHLLLTNPLTIKL